MVFFSYKVTDSTRHTPTPVSSNQSNNLGATIAALQGQLPIPLFLQNQMGIGLNDLNAIHAIQQLQNLMLMNSGQLNSGSGNATAAALLM